MKNLIIAVFILFNFYTVSATDYYVSSSGNDSNNGTTSSSPWKTISKVSNSTFKPGDRILFNKGNIWQESLTVSSSGNSSLPITYGAYGSGVNPLIDLAKTLDRCITLTGKSYIVIDGIDCRNARINGIASPSSPGTHIKIQNLTISNIGTSDAEQDGIIQQGGYLTIDNCTITQISRCGIMFGGGHNIITNNRVSYTNLYYTTWGAGIDGNGDGDVIAYNVIDHCGGVGFIGKTHGIYVELSNGDVHHNTITNQTRGAGIKSTGSGNFHHNNISGSSHSGILAGTNGKSSGGPFTVNIYYNIFTGNRQGISESDQGSVGFTLNIYNNVFYNNNSTQADNYYSEIAIEQNVNTALVIKNNILFGSGRYTYAFNTAQSHATINNNCVYEASGSIYYNGSVRSWSSWQGLGFDSNGINTNPGLVSPPSNFHLNTGSPAIGAGTNVGLTSDYGGTSVTNPPSIGAYESGSAPAPTPVVPVYVSSVVTNATPSLLELTYNTALANISPATSAFLVNVNSVARTVTAVAASGTKVQLTLISPILSGDVVTVSYTKPSVNPLQTASSGQAESLSAQTVTISVSATIPAYVSSVVSNTTPSLLEMTYSLALGNFIPATSAFSVLVNSTARTVSSVAISGTKVQLILGSPILYGDVVTVVYTKPATNPLQGTAGGQPVSITSKTVTNNCTPTIPEYTSSALQNATPTLLEMNYNLALANVVPATSSFVVLVNAVATTVNTVVVSGTKVQLTLASAIKFGDLVTVSYNKPEINPLQTAANVTAASISSRSVTNNLVDPTKTAPISISLRLYPSYVHSTLNAILSYSSTPTSILTPQLIRILNYKGTLFVEKLVQTGITNLKIPINLKSGIYYVKIISNGKEMASQKMYVY